MPWATQFNMSTISPKQYKALLALIQKQAFSMCKYKVWFVSAKVNLFFKLSIPFTKNTIADIFLKYKKYTKLLNWQSSSQFAKFSIYAQIVS